MPKTRSSWIALTVVFALILAVLAWLLVISPKRSETSDLHDQTENQQAQNATLEIRVAALRKQFEEIDTYKAALAENYQRIPTTLTLETVVGDLDSAAGVAGLVLEQVSGLDGVDLTLDSPSQPTPTASATPSASGGSSAAPTATATQDAAVNLVALPVTTVTYGTYEQTLAYLEGVQRQTTRYYLVSGIQIEVVDAASVPALALVGVSGPVLRTTANVFAFVNNDPNARPSASASSDASPEVPQSDDSRFGLGGGAAQSETTTEGSTDGATTEGE